MTGLHTLKRMSKRPSQRVGRGGKRGKTSGRGGKGQTARAGAKIRPAWRDIIKKLPKRRGFGKNRARGVVGSRPDAVAVSLERLERLFESGSEVTPITLQDRGVIRRIGRSLFPVKIVGGELTKKLTIKGCAVSASARAAIEKVGGQVN